MFSSFKNKATAIVKSLDPVEHIKFLSKQVTDDPSVLNQNLRDVIKHIGSGPHHDRADQALGCMIASHASRHLSTIWTVLLQMLREAVDNTRSQICILIHFSHIANRIAIPQRANAFRVFAKEIISVCGSQDIVGDRQFPIACNATLMALGVHADVDLARALMEKLLAGIFSWTRSDSKRSACTICSTLTFNTTGCDSFCTTLTNLQSSGRSLHGIALLVDNNLQPLMEQAIRLSPGTDPTQYVSVVEVSRWVVDALLKQLSEDGTMETMVMPILSSCYSRLHTFATQYESAQAAQATTPMILSCDNTIRQRAVALLKKKDDVKKILWCPIISLLQQTGLSSDDSSVLESEVTLLEELGECSDSMARCEALIAMACAVDANAISSAVVDRIVTRMMARHRHYSSERCNMTVKGILRLLSSCFQHISSQATASEVLHILLRSHMDMSNSMNAMAVLQLEVLSLVEHTVGQLSGEALAYLMMCLKKGDAKVREKAVSVLLRLCDEASIDALQLSEPTLRGVDFLEGATAASDVGERSLNRSTCLSSSRLLQTARNYHTVMGYFHHLLVSASYDTPKEENAMVQTIVEALQRLVVGAQNRLGVLFLNRSPSTSSDVSLASSFGGRPLEHQLLAILGTLFNCVSGATPYPIDTICIVLDAMVSCVDMLADSTTQFDAHFHKRLFNFAWNIIVLCCQDIDAVASLRFSSDASLYTGVVPPHPILAALISAAGKTAMSSSAWDHSSSFFSLIAHCTRLMEHLLRWGHRSRICIAHMRVQFHSFLSAMDVVVATHPVDALRCTRRLVLTVLTSPQSTPDTIVPAPRVTAELCERVAASAIPILNRSLSFDLMTVGRDVFKLLETLVDIDTAASMTACYTTMDRSFQLFIRMVEIVTDGSYYNAIAGPSVVPPILRSLCKVLNSPHRLRALQTVTPALTEEAMAGKESVSLREAFPPLETAISLIRNAHDRLQSRVFADVEAIVDAAAPSIVPSSRGAGAPSSSTGEVSEARHQEVMRWLASPNSTCALVQFVSTLSDTIQSIGCGTDAAVVLMRECLFQQSKAVASKQSAEVKSALTSTANALLDLYSLSLKDAATPAVPISWLLCAAALDRSTLQVVCQSILDAASTPMGSSRVSVTAVDVCNLSALLEDPSSSEVIDVIHLTLPDTFDQSLTLPDNALIVHCARVLFTVLPATARWTISKGFLSSPAFADAISSDSLTSLYYIEPLLVLTVRQSLPIPATPFLAHPSIWSLLVELNMTYPVSVAGVGDTGREAIGVAVRTLVESASLLSDVRAIAQCVSDTVCPTCMDHIAALAPQLTAAEERECERDADADAEEETARANLNLEYFRYYLMTLSSIVDTAVAANAEDVAGVCNSPTGTPLMPPLDVASNFSSETAPVSVLGLVRSIPFNGRNLLEFPPSVFTVDDIEETALVCMNRSDGTHLIKALLSLCARDPKAVTQRCLIRVVCALVRCEISPEDVPCDASTVISLLKVIASCARSTADYRSSRHSMDERLALRYAVMFLLILSSPEVDGQWERVLEDTAHSAASPQLVESIETVRPLVIGILATVLELPLEEASIKGIAQGTLSIFVRSSLLLGGINESILWLVVKACPSALWQCVVSKELFSDTELGVLQFVCKMNQTVGVGPELVMELHARYTPLLLSYGSSRELDADEQHMAFWLMTSLLLHIVNSEERYTKPMPHMALTDSLPLYNDFPLAQMASPVVGFIRSTVDELLFPISSRLSVPNSERHWNIHARGHLLPVLGRRPLAKSDAGKMYSSILHMYLHVVNSVFSSLETFGPNTVSDTFSSLSVLASGNAALLKHSPSAEGTIASSILQRLFNWYGKYASDAVSNVDKSQSAVHFGNSLFPEPSSSIDFCDNFNILTCATVISSLFMRGNEQLPNAVDVSFILDKMLSMDLMSHQAALTAVVVMSGSSTRREMSIVAPLLTQRLLRELDRCMRGSLSFSFGIMQMLRTAFSILCAFPDDAVTMKVCEAVWNVVVNEGSGGRRIQHYAHYMLQSIVNLHTVSETQWSILRAIVSLPDEEPSHGSGGRPSHSRDGGQGGDLAGSFAFAANLFEKDSSAGRMVESGRQFFSDLLNANDGIIPTAANLLNGTSEMIEWGFQPIRNTIVSAGMRRRAQLSVAESEEASVGAATVYGATPNLLQLTTIASFVLRSHEGGEGGLDEADRNRVTILDMLKQVDDEPSAVGDTFLCIVHALLETVLDPRDGMFVLLNRFNFSSSSLYLFNQSLSRWAKMAGYKGLPYPSEELSLYLESAGRRDINADNAWWVLANALASCVQWWGAACESGSFAVASTHLRETSQLQCSPPPLVVGADVPLCLMLGSSLLRVICQHFIRLTEEVKAFEKQSLPSLKEGAEGSKSSVSKVTSTIFELVEKVASQQESQQEGSGVALKSVAMEVRRMLGEDKAVA